LIGVQELCKQIEKQDDALKGENLKHCRYFSQLPLIEIDWNDKLFTKIRKLWRDPALKRAWKESSSYQLQMVHLDYLMDNLERIASDDYVPNNEDMLRARQRTTGEQTISFTIEQNIWELIDVGGQRPERTKWEKIITSHEINAIVWFAALDEYNMASVEEKDKTKMQISRQVFSEVLNSEAVKSRPHITLLLFLNKIDLLKVKLSNEKDRKEFITEFPEFEENLTSLTEKTEEGEISIACESVKNSFTRYSNGPVIHTHYTCALDTSLMEAVFNEVRKTIFDNRIVNVLKF